MRHQLTPIKEVICKHLSAETREPVCACERRCMCVCVFVCVCVRHQWEGKRGMTQSEGGKEGLRGGRGGGKDEAVTSLCEILGGER